jgi:hypothetical protein
LLFMPFLIETILFLIEELAFNSSVVFYRKN